jgi:acetyl esterase/lipase
MSLRAELLRVGIRLFLKPGLHPGISIDERRRKLRACETWISRPPRGTRNFDTSFGTIPAVRVSKPNVEPARHVLFLHGGGYITGSPALYRHVLRRFADACKAEIVALTPVVQCSVTPPAVGWRSPWLCVFGTRVCRCPHASPLYGDPTGLPPILLQVGSDEILRDDSTRMAERLRAGGCDVTLEVWPRMPHVWHAFAPVMPEATRAIRRIGAFMNEVLTRLPVSLN